MGYPTIMTTDGHCDGCGLIVEECQCVWPCDHSMTERHHKLASTWAALNGSSEPGQVEAIEESLTERELIALIRVRRGQTPGMTLSLSTIIATCFVTLVFWAALFCIMAFLTN